MAKPWIRCVLSDDCPSVCPVHILTTCHQRFKDKPLPPEEVSSKAEFLDRALAYQLLRDGHFDIYNNFVQESSAFSHVDDDLNFYEKDRQSFETLHNILRELQENKSLDSAIAWAREHEEGLEIRGSNLLFELCRQKFVNIFMKAYTPAAAAEDPDYDVDTRLTSAHEYALNELVPFLPRYEEEIMQCIASLAFFPNSAQSPYAAILHSPTAYADLARTFTREYCALLVLPADSALFTAVTAGALALPTILKVQSIMASKNAAWSTEHELPVEIPLPKRYNFHSIFVCAVSKEQSTDENPPFMLACGHLLSKESLDKMVRAGKVKCHYCNVVGNYRDAMQVVV